MQRTLSCISARRDYSSNAIKSACKELYCQYATYLHRTEPTDELNNIYLELFSLQNVNGQNVYEQLRIVKLREGNDREMGWDGGAQTSAGVHKERFEVATNNANVPVTVDEVALLQLLVDPEASQNPVNVLIEVRKRS